MYRGLWKHLIAFTIPLEHARKSESIPPSANHDEPFLLKRVFPLSLFFGIEFFPLLFFYLHCFFLFHGYVTSVRRKIFPSSHVPLNLAEAAKLSWAHGFFPAASHEGKSQSNFVSEFSVAKIMSMPFLLLLLFSATLTSGGFVYTLEINHPYFHWPTYSRTWKSIRSISVIRFCWDCSKR